MKIDDLSKFDKNWQIIKIYRKSITIYVVCKKIDSCSKLEENRLMKLDQNRQKIDMKINSLYEKKSQDNLLAYMALAIG